MKKISIFLILPILFLTACQTDQQSKEISDESETLFQFEESEYDFGLIKQSGGIVSHDFMFTYTGEEAITVTSTPGSCACTTAEISQTNFQPGDSGVLTVYFNPNLHAEPEGRFFKSVLLMTEPSISPAPEVKLWQEIDLDLGEEFFELQEDHDDDHDEEISLIPTKLEFKRNSIFINRS